MGTNNITIHGRLTAVPELKRTPQGTAYCQITVAVSRNFKDASGQYQADFFTVACWRATAELVAKHFVKGSEIIVNGSMQCDRYTDKDGKDCTFWKLQANSIDFCGNKVTGEQSQALSQTPTANGFTEVTPDDDVPF